MHDKTDEPKPPTPTKRNMSGSERLDGVRAAIEAGKKLPPIQIGVSDVLGPKETGRVGDPHVIDGHHRMMVNMARGASHIEAEMPEHVARHLGLV